MSLDSKGRSKNPQKHATFSNTYTLGKNPSVLRRAIVRPNKKI